jgi:hypothetical protein
MIVTKFNSKQFMKDMNNMMNYSAGFLDGIQLGKVKFFNLLGLETIEMLKRFIDSNAKANPEMLHHVYEWHKTGSPDARLYDINYTVSNLGLSFRSTFSQSRSIKNGSTEPFYDKARIMEQGIPVVITPKNAEVLKFELDGEEVFTRGPVYVENPGGAQAQGGFNRVFEMFFSKYFTQAFLKTSGISDYISKPKVYSKNLPAGKRAGKSKGIETGYRWIVNAGVGN